MSTLKDAAAALGRRGGLKGGKSKSKKKLAASLANLAKAHRARRRKTLA